MAMLLHHSRINYKTDKVYLLVSKIVGGLLHSLIESYHLVR